MILLSIMGFALAVLGCYLIGGGWVDNGFELYRNYRRSHLPLTSFIQLLVPRSHRWVTFSQ